MARFLFRLGRAAAGRPLVTVLVWLVVLASAAGGMATFGKPLTTEFSLPDSEFGRVLDHLGAQVPAVAGGTGTVVVRSADGFTASQREALLDTYEEWESLPDVREVVDPFAVQRTLDESMARVERGEQRLAKARTDWYEGDLQLRGARALVAEGRRDLARLEAARPQDPWLSLRRRGQADLEAQVRDGERRLEAGRERLGAATMDLEAGRRLLDNGAGVRMISEDGRTALVQVRFDDPMPEIAPEELAEVPEIGAALEKVGLQVDYGQEIVPETEVGGVAELLGLAVAAVVLLVMLGSLVLAGLPLLVAFAGVAITMLAGLTLTRFVEIQQMAPVLGSMLGLAVGIDYALFVVNRHRRQLAEMTADPRRGQLTREDFRTSIALATGTAGSAVVVAGATVVIALAALLLSGIPTLSQMGLLAAATVTVTVLVALTLTPALLALVGRRAVPQRRARPDAPRGHHDGFPERWVALVSRRAVAVSVLAVVALGVLAIPAAELRLGLPDGGSTAVDSTAYRAYEGVRQAFGAGANGPVIVAADVEALLDDDALRDVQARVSDEVARVPGVADVLPIGTSEDRRTLAFQIVPREGPSAESTVLLVDALQGGVSDRLAAQGVEIGVTGQTVANIEISERLADALPLYLALVVGLSLVLLTIVFRSLVVPLLATAGFMLSVGASFGAIVAVYQWGWLGGLFDVHQPGAVLSFMPILLVGILFGLAMDYQMFLVSGMHESYAHGEPARQAVRSGFSSGARVVFAAGLIMVSVFAGFIYSPMTMARPIGFGLAVGVLADAFVVRMTLTPALMSLLGEKAWWMPGWLDRLLPHLDVEGSSLVDARRAASGAEVEPELAVVGAGVS